MGIHRPLGLGWVEMEGSVGGVGGWWVALGVLKPRQVIITELNLISRIKI